MRDWQKETLALILEYSQERGYAPSVRDIASAQSLGTSAVQHRLEVLEARGLIRRTPGVARSIVLVKEE